MNEPTPRLAGIELYFDDLDRAREFYRTVLGLTIADEERARYTKFTAGAGFLCLERKGSESYPSHDKAVLFFEVGNLEVVCNSIGRERLVHKDAGWAVLHDPEGHNILLLERPERTDRAQ